MIIYKKNFDENGYICFLIKEEKVSVTYKEILQKVSNTIKKKFHSKPIYNKKCLDAEKIKHKKRLSMFICTNNID